MCNISEKSSPSETRLARTSPAIIINTLSIALLFLTSFSVSLSHAQCNLTLGYRTEDKPPYMAGTNQQTKAENSGIYQELYSKASNRVKCTLRIVRKPKKRILMELKSGSVDIYPAFNFTKLRAKDFYFIDSGLSKQNVGISRYDLEEITNLEQLRGKTAMLAFGSLNRYQSIQGVDIYEIPNLTIAQVIRGLKLKRADFYFSNYSEFLYYQQNNYPLTGGYKIHHHCCGSPKVVYMAFSKKSPYYQEKVNPNFNSNQAISPLNQPTEPLKTSIAYKLFLSLQQMKNEGISKKIHNQYFNALK